MSKELQKLTNDTYVLEIENESLMYFYRKDNGVLKNVGIMDVLELVAEYIVSQPLRYGYVESYMYKFNIETELSNDLKVLKVTNDFNMFHNFRRRSRKKMQHKRNDFSAFLKKLLCELVL